MATNGERESRDASTGAAGQLRVVLLYEDAETGLRARASLAAVEHRAAPEFGFQTKLWRRDLLRAAWLREQAALDAAGAEVIIVSLHGQDGVPPEVSDWLSRWQELKAERPYALGLLVDDAVAARDGTHPVAAHFRAVAATAGADLVWRFGDEEAVGSQPTSDQQSVIGNQGHF